MIEEWVQHARDGLRRAESEITERGSIYRRQHVWQDEHHLRRWGRHARAVRATDHQRAICDAWNASNAPGQAVDLLRDDGRVERTRTRSHAWMVGQTAIVLVEGRVGGYALDRIARVDR